ncbi:hypothetical protein F5Y18DRAFT_289868 [Xylariaceae sp. FL1019]|nr:hypothetical protein F5Y18DRAFT_289868 [Xylariaceae sp. FL1019]
MWITTASGERITQDTLPYVVDPFPFNLYEHTIAPEVRMSSLGPNPGRSRNGCGSDGKSEAKEEPPTARASLWLPTVVMNLENKIVLPSEGAKWLSVRITSKHIQMGRFDLDVIVRDVEGQMIALSHHVALMLDVERSATKTPLNEPLF